MTHTGFPADRLMAAPEATRPRMLNWVRLVLVVAAIGCGTLAYHDHFSGELPWWRWVVVLCAGWALLVLALPHDRPPAENALRLWTRRAFYLLAACATAIAVHLFPQLGRELETGIAIAVALGAFVIARWVPFAPADIHALIGEPTADEVVHPPFTVARCLIIVTALVVAVAAAVVNPAHHLFAFVLWLASLALFAVAMWQRGVATDVPAQRWVNEAGRPVSPRTAAVALLFILLLAVAFRVTVLQNSPGLIDPDEGRQGRYAERIWQPGFPDAFDIGWNVFPHLSYMIEYDWVLLLGTSNPHLRLSAATIGVLSVVPAFFWARRWWGNIIALLGALLLAINWEHINWSRLALNNIQQVVVASLMLATYSRVLKTRRWLDWVWFGYATGLAFHTYHAAKLFPALIAVTGVLFAIGIRGFTRRYAAGALVGVLAFLLCFGPLTVTIYHRWEAFYGGTSNRSDLVHLTDAYHRGEAREVRNYLNSHVLGCLYSFISVPSWRGATFDAYVAVPFLLGVGWMFWHWRDPRHLVVLIWTAGILGIGGMITDYPPWKARLIGYLPVVTVIAAVVIGRIRGILVRLSPRADVLAVPVFVVWLGAALYQTWDTTFLYWPPLQGGDLMTQICRVITQTPSPATFYFARGGETVDLKVSVNDCMIAADPERVLVDLADDPLIVPIRPDNRGTAVLLVASYQQELVPLIRHYYPNAPYTVVNDPHYGSPFLHVFTLSSAEIERSRGLRATYRSQNDTWSADTPSTEFVPADGHGFPVSVTWRGQVWIPTPGSYAIRGTGGAVRVDEKPLSGDGARVLSAGWHAIELSATFDKPGERAALEWKPPGTDAWRAIPRNFLNAHPETHGLLGRYFASIIDTSAADPIAAVADYTQIDNALSFDYIPQQDEAPPAPFAARPSTMEWVGTVEAPEGDSVKLRLETTVPAQVFVNGKLVLTSPGRRDGAGVEADLVGLSGRVPILVRAVRAADDNWQFWKLRLLWREPGGGWTAFAHYRPPENEATNRQLSAVSPKKE